MVAADDVQAQVQAGRDACAGEDLTLIDVQHVSLHSDPRVLRREQVRSRPMGGGGQAVE